MHAGGRGFESPTVHVITIEKKKVGTDPNKNKFRYFVRWWHNGVMTGELRVMNADHAFSIVRQTMTRRVAMDLIATLHSAELD